MRHKPLKLVIEHYRRLRDDSVATQAKVQMEFGAAQRTQQTLEQYRQEQLQRARDSQQNPLSTINLLLQTRFSGKLDEAIALQSQRVAELQQRLEQSRAQVLRHQQRLKAIETIEDRRAAQVQKKASRADQLATDERAADAHARDARRQDDRKPRASNPRPANLY